VDLGLFISLGVKYLDSARVRRTWLVFAFILKTAIDRAKEQISQRKQRLSEKNTHQFGCPGSDRNHLIVLWDLCVFCGLSII